MQSVSAGPSATWMDGVPGITVTGPTGATAGTSTNSENSPSAELPKSRNV